jgi:hypothetical protein
MSGQSFRQQLGGLRAIIDSMSLVSIGRGIVCGCGFGQMLGGLCMIIDSASLVFSGRGIVRGCGFGKQLGSLRGIIDSASLASIGKGIVPGAVCVYGCVSSTSRCRSSCTGSDFVCAYGYA